MKKIDIHAHVSMWQGAPMKKGVNFITAPELKESYEKIGVDKGFIMPLLSPECRFNIQTNEEMEYVSKTNPESFFWLCNIDPRMGDNNEKTDFSYYLNYYKQKGAVGLGELVANMYIDDPMMENLLFHCGECDMPVIIHIAPKTGGNYGIVDDLGLYRIEKMLKKYPKLKIVGHSQCFWSEIGTNVNNENRDGYVTGKIIEGRVAKLLRECPNLYCDLSAGSGFNALTRDLDYTYKFIEEFSDRLMFGTDIVFANQQLPLSKWLDDSFNDGYISEENYKKICRENAIRIFNLNLK
ncbi:MAG: hypothetical protein E7405_03065 [Ruminococcaceae bacterium]|nr:hypothetical protein [Oscillospiraceae bacterium]